MASAHRKQPARSSSNRRYSVRNRKRKITITIILSVVIALLIAAGIWAYFYFRTFDHYTVEATLDITNSDERTVYLAGKKSYIKCAGDGITCFDKKGVIWAETFEMTQPLTDICGSYVAVADLKGSDIYIYDDSGLVNRLSVSQPIMKVEVSAQGVVAAATNDGVSNYIVLMDKEGNELVTAKSVFNTSGYLRDISLSEDGSIVAAAFIYVSEGNLESKVVFYDFTEDSQNQITGGFNQYKDTVVTNVEFLNSSTVCAVGDNAITFYQVRPTPSIIYEDLNLQWEIQSAFFGPNRLGLIVEDETSEFSHTMKVYNERGKLIGDQGFDFVYNRVSFAGNDVLLYSANDCEIYSLNGRCRYSGSFDERIEYLLPCGNSREFVYATANRTEFIKIH